MINKRGSVVQFVLFFSRSVQRDKLLPCLKQVVPQHKPKRTRVRDEIPRGGAANHADKVFVGGISWQAHETDLTNFFCQYGHVADAKIIRDSVTGKSKGYVEQFVSFLSEG